MLIDKICDEIDILEKDYFSCSYKDSQDVQVCGGYGGWERERDGYGDGGEIWIGGGGKCGGRRKEMGGR